MNILIAVNNTDRTYFGTDCINYTCTIVNTKCILQRSEQNLCCVSEVKQVKGIHRNLCTKVLC